MIKSLASLPTNLLSLIGLHSNSGPSRQLVVAHEDVLSDAHSSQDSPTSCDETLSLPDYCIDRGQSVDESPLPLALLPYNITTTNNNVSSAFLHPQFQVWLPFSPLAGAHFRPTNDFLPPLRHSFSEDGISSKNIKSNKHRRLQSAFSSQLTLAEPEPQASLLLLPPATHSPFKLEFGMATSQGVPRYNEDASFAGINEQGRLWFGIFDGHGGYEVSNYLAEHVAKHLNSDEINSKGFVPREAGGHLQTLIEQMEVELEQQYNDEWEGQGRDPGSTLMVGSVGDDGLMTVANCGDCRCILISQAFDKLGNRMAFVSRKTHDHCIGNFAEEARMKASLAEKWGVSNPLLLSNADYLSKRINGSLEVSRSIGDFGSKRALPGGVIADPDIYEWDLSAESDLLAIAISDGISSVMDDMEICHQICRSLNDPKHLNNLEKAAADLNAYAIAHGSEDNVTSIVISFHADILPPAPHRRKLFGPR